jgi:uncharacterized protein (DUF342 family)
VVELKNIREFMKSQAEADRSRRWVQTEGVDLEDALRQAAIEIGVPVKKLEYEVRDPGKKGLLGVGKSLCVIVAYPMVEPIEEGIGDDLLSMDLGLGDDDEERNHNGEVFVQLRSEGVFLKVNPPAGKGSTVTEKQAVEALNQRAVHEYDRSMVKKVVKQADGSFVRVGEFIHNPSADAVLTVDITDFDMKAFIVVRPPAPGGADMTFDNIVNVLKNNGVIHGIDEKSIRKFEEKPSYGEPFLIASGTKPQNGEDAKVIYNFEVDRSKIKLKEKNGRVDFKETNLVQNVVEGQALAKKIPAGEGRSGRTVSGKLLPAKDGKDVQIGIGKNVRLSDDGLTAIATINGQVMLQNEKINVEPIYVVPGDVNLKTGGNVIFLGTVLVKGNVEDGFKVKAAGNIEVLGNVGKSELDAEGDIIVHQGILGKGGGNVNAGKGVWAKFIENANVEAGELVMASDGIINSNVEAVVRIICQGKRATIVGGRLRSAEEIAAKTLGSVSGSETILEVGFDPKSKEKLVLLNEKRTDLDKNFDELKRNITTLETIKKQRKKELTEEKEKYLQDLIRQRKLMQEEKISLNEQIEELQNYLSSLKVRGKISASERVFPGVKVIIKDASLETKSEYKSVTFINEDNLVKVTKYEEPEEDYSKKR